MEIKEHVEEISIKRFSEQTNKTLYVRIKMKDGRKATYISTGTDTIGDIVHELIRRLR